MGDSDKKKKYLKTAAVAGGVVGGIGAAALAGPAMAAIGFTQAGIAAGSYAAAWMSSTAIASGGGIISGSLISILQSASMAGLGLAGTAAVGTAGAAAGAAVGAVGGGTADVIIGDSSDNEDTPDECNLSSDIYKPE